MTPNDLTIEVIDRTVGGKCSNCGECCTEFVPITKREYKTIKEYLKRHPEITNEQHDTPEGRHVLCPFRDREKKCCKIYEVRPLVCQKFICNLPEDTLQKNKVFGLSRAYYNNFETTMTVSFHTLFFNDVDWELAVLREMLGGDLPTFTQRLRDFNPVILHEHRIIIEEE